MNKVRVAIFGAGRVGTAMSAEMPGVPVVRRGGDMACDVACVAWPAHAVAGFREACPLAAAGRVVAFCNGAWAVADGADHAGICYVHAVELGDKATRDKSWRVGNEHIARSLTAAGLGVTCSREGHERFIWGKCLYLIPLVLACADTGMGTREAIQTAEHMEWYDVVRCAAVEAIGEREVQRTEARVKFLWKRSPARALLAWLPEEVEYFRRRLCVD